MDLVLDSDPWGREPLGMPLVLGGPCDPVCAPCADEEPNPAPDPGFGEFVVRVRRQMFDDSDGNTRWQWETLGTLPGLLRDLARVETSDTGGQTRVSAVLELFTEVAPPRETCRVYEVDGPAWDVSSVTSTGLAWSLDVSRVDDGP